MNAETPTPPSHDPDHEGFLDVLREAAYEAEVATGRHEETVEEVRRSLLHRLLRATAGFLLIGVGIAALPLPGPGWVIIIVGLSLLPYVWAERTIRLIRRRIPGIPEDGRIPTRTWVVMAALLAATTSISLLWGGEIAGWASETWSDLVS